MQPIVLTKTLAASNATIVAALQRTSAAGPVTLVSAPVTLDTQRRVLVTSQGNDAGINFVLTGTREGGQPIGETLAGTNASSALSSFDYLTVTSITTSGATASGITAGTTTVGSTSWKLPNYHLTPFQLNIGVAVTAGVVNYTVEYTYDDFVTVTPGGSTYQPALPTPPVAFALTALATQSSNKDGGFIGNPIRGWRLTVNSGTGTAVATGIQAGIRN